VGLPPLPPVWRGATLATTPLHPAGDAGAERCTPQLGQIGPWHERLFHFRVDQPPSSGHELQTEYFVARHLAPAAIAALVALHDRIRPHLRISEIRTVAADTLWLSPAYDQPTVSLHFTWHKDWPAVAALLPVIEAALAPFAPRPHWGKLSALPATAVVAAYPRAAEFAALRQLYDPQGKFRNALLAAWWG
jgi:xylitol oxidase